MARAVLPPLHVVREIVEMRALFVTGLAAGLPTASPRRFTPYAQEGLTLTTVSGSRGARDLEKIREFIRRAMVSASAQSASGRSRSAV